MVISDIAEQLEALSLGDLPYRDTLPAQLEVVQTSISQLTLLMETAENLKKLLQKEAARLSADIETDRYCAAVIRKNMGSRR